MTKTILDEEKENKCCNFFFVPITDHPQIDIALVTFTLFYGFDICFLLIRTATIWNQWLHTVSLNSSFSSWNWCILNRLLTHTRTQSICFDLYVPIFIVVHFNFFYGFTSIQKCMYNDRQPKTFTFPIFPFIHLMDEMVKSVMCDFLFTCFDVLCSIQQSTIIKLLNTVSLFWCFYTRKHTYKSMNGLFLNK